MAKYSGADGFCYEGASVNISNATHNTGVVTIDTSPAHGKAVGDIIRIENVAGMTDLNADFEVLGVTDADTLTVTLTTAQSYTSGGTVRQLFYIDNWDATIETDVKNVTDSSSSGNEENIPSGFTRASGTITGFVLDGMTRLTNGSTITLQLNYNTTDYWSGSGTIISEPITLQVNGGDALKVVYTFTGTGAWSETNS